MNARNNLMRESSYSPEWRKLVADYNRKVELTDLRAQLLEQVSALRLAEKTLDALTERSDAITAALRVCRAVIADAEASAPTKGE